MERAVRRPPYFLGGPLRVKVAQDGKGQRVVLSRPGSAEVLWVVFLPCLGRKVSFSLN